MIASPRLLPISFFPSRPTSLGTSSTTALSSTKIGAFSSSKRRMIFRVCSMCGSRSGRFYTMFVCLGETKRRQAIKGASIVASDKSTFSLRGGKVTYHTLRSATIPKSRTMPFVEDEDPVDLRGVTLLAAPYTSDLICDGKVIVNNTE